MYNLRRSIQVSLIKKIGLTQFCYINLQIISNLKIPNIDHSYLLTYRWRLDFFKIEYNNKVQKKVFFYQKDEFSKSLEFCF